MKTAMIPQKLKGTIQIFRPELPFAAGVCVILGEVLALGKFPAVREALLGFLCGFFISGAAIVLNDYFDLEVDRINTPDRPLPSGLISPREAILLTALATLIGLLASLRLGFASFILTVIFWGIGVLYNSRFKESGLLGNLMVSSSVGITLILGALAVHDPWNKIVWCFAWMAFFVDLGEEIAGDAMDIEGDRKRDSRSVAILRGKRFALSLSTTLFGLAVLISFVPVIMGWMGLVYLLMILATDILIVVFIIGLLKSQTPEQGRRSMRGIYLGALFGLLAAIVGQVVLF